MKQINEDVFDEIKRMIVDFLGDRERADINGQVIKSIYRKDGEIYIEDAHNVSKPMEESLLLMITNIEEIKNNIKE